MTCRPFLDYINAWPEVHSYVIFMYVRVATGRYWISCFIVGYHNLVGDLFVSFGTAVFHILNEGIEYITRNDHLPIFLWRHTLTTAARLRYVHGI